MLLIEKMDWVKALRSGKYEQGMTKLRGSYLQIAEDESSIKNNYCCLGVLCEIMDPTGWEVKDKDMHGAKISPRLFHPMKDENGDEYLSEKALKELYIDKQVMKILAKMNDTGKSFVEIANFIEEYL